MEVFQRVLSFNGFVVAGTWRAWVEAAGLFQSVLRNNDLPKISIDDLEQKVIAAGVGYFALSLLWSAVQG